MITESVLEYPRLNSRCPGVWRLSAGGAGHRPSLVRLLGRYRRGNARRARGNVLVYSACSTDAYTPGSRQAIGRSSVADGSEHIREKLAEWLTAVVTEERRLRVALSLIGEEVAPKRPRRGRPPKARGPQAGKRRGPKRKSQNSQPRKAASGRSAKRPGAKRGGDKAKKAGSARGG